MKTFKENLDVDSFDQLLLHVFFCCYHRLITQCKDLPLIKVNFCSNMQMKWISMREEQDPWQKRSVDFIQVHEHGSCFDLVSKGICLPCLFLTVYIFNFLLACSRHLVSGEQREPPFPTNRKAWNRLIFHSLDSSSDISWLLRENVQVWMYELQVDTCVLWPYITPNFTQAQRGGRDLFEILIEHGHLIKEIQCHYFSSLEMYDWATMFVWQEDQPFSLHRDKTSWFVWSIMIMLIIYVLLCWRWNYTTEKRGFWLHRRVNFKKLCRVCRRN